MARYNEFAGPKLPTQLLEKVYGGKVDKHGKQESSRKEKRKAERASKKKVPLRTKKPVKWQAAAARREAESESDEEEEEEEEEVKPKVKSAVPAKDAKPVKSILKTRPSNGGKVEIVEKAVQVVEGDEDEDKDEEDEEEQETDIDSQDDEEEEDDFTISREAPRVWSADRWRQPHIHSIGAATILDDISIYIFLTLSTMAAHLSSDEVRAFSELNHITTTNHNSPPVFLTTHHPPRFHPTKRPRLHLPHSKAM